MALTKLQTNQPVRIAGPFWSAQAKAWGSGSPAEPALRALFVENVDLQRLYRPGTLLAVVSVSQVEIDLGKRYQWKAGSLTPAATAKLRDEIRAGRLALLLLEADPGSTAETYRCLAGEIALLEQGAEGIWKELHQDLGLTRIEQEPGQRPGAARMAAPAAVNGSGVSLLGAVDVPWSGRKVSGIFRVAPADPTAVGKARLVLERDRLTPGERSTLRDAWRVLGARLNPPRAAQPAGAPAWVTLDLADRDALPHLTWQLTLKLGAAPALGALVLNPDELRLLLSDQHPDDPARPATSLAQVRLGEVTLKAEGGVLTVTAGAGAATSSQPELSYTARKAGTGWRETFVLEKDLQFAFDPVQVPRSLRDQQGLPVPEWHLIPQAKSAIPGQPEAPAQNVPLDPAVVWGFLPLEDGWAQLPIPNLTEQAYVEGGLLPKKEGNQAAPGAEQKDDAPHSVLQGAVAYGNLEYARLRPDPAHPAEQPWSLTLLGTPHVRGEWRFSGATPALAEVDLHVFEPSLLLDGLFWLSTGRPTPADALPDPDWLTGLQPVSLRLVRAGDEAGLYPPLVRLAMPQLSFTLRSTAGKGEGGAGAVVDAKLEPWKLTYQVDPDLFEATKKVGLLPAEAFSAHRPLIWRRHPALPLVQALPLTQVQSPPNHPSASRQLAPFDLAVKGELPDDWIFEGPGATAWPTAKADGLKPAREWAEWHDLGLASLSLPGLVFDPAGGIKGTPGAGSVDGLPWQYRYDLPYADELNALAQLPPPVRPAVRGKEPPAPGQPADEGAAAPGGNLAAGAENETVQEGRRAAGPLTRETLAEHWARLSTQASLAAVDAAEALGLEKNGQALEIQNLVEPLAWPVTAVLDQDTYPGRLALAGRNGDASPLDLAGADALRGISGSFRKTPGDKPQLERLPDGSPDPAAYRVEAGSLAAHLEGDGLRDQRGLLRHATTKPAGLLRTPVQMEEGPGPVRRIELTSALEPLSLGAGSNTWLFWFRDLPVEVEADQKAFRRSRSDQAQDANDPEATSRAHNFRQGYEWRLGLASIQPLEVGGFRFYPLSLELVKLEGDEVTAVEVVGRLQLPAKPEQELDAFDNAARLTFAGQGALRLVRIAPEPYERNKARVEWPLAVGQAGEAGAAPRLVWEGEVADSVNWLDGIQVLVTGARLEFFLFGKSWSLEVPRFTAAAAEVVVPRSTSPIAVEQVLVTLDSGGAHRAAARLALRLGEEGEPASWEGTAELDLVGQAVAWADGPRLLGMPIRPQGELDSLYRGSLAVQWEGGLAQELPPQLLPGMPLIAEEQSGYLALAFDAQQGQSLDLVQSLNLTSAFLEALFPCRWGAFLQDVPGQLPGWDRSSAGALTAGYAAEWQRRSGGETAGVWRQSLVLDGFLEVTDLFSWPLGATHDQAGHTLTLPGVGDALAHTRHALRVLLNQHQPPADLLVRGREGLLFDLPNDQPWEFLAVAEHQLVDVEPAGGALSNDRRWTAVQEVRLLKPALYAEFLEHLDRFEGAEGVASMRSGYLAAALRALLKVQARSLPEGTLLVEASAHHWLREVPLDSAAPSLPLQFLPTGNSLALLSSPDDYAPLAAEAGPGGWLLLTAPFLGRLQADDPAPAWPDPVAVLRGQAPDPKVRALALALAHRADAGAQVKMPVPDLDGTAGRAWPRLDPASLEESWLRLHFPPPELAPGGLPGVTAALPDTPARLGRAAALRRLFDAGRAGSAPAAGAGPVAAPAAGAESRGRQATLLPLANPGFADPHPSIGKDRLEDLKRELGVAEGQALPAHVPDGWQILEIGLGSQARALKPDLTLGPAGPDLGVRLQALGFADEKPGQGCGFPNLVRETVDRAYGAVTDDAPHWLVYTDHKPQSRLYLSLGQHLTLRPGKYRFSLWVFAVHHKDNYLVPSGILSQARLSASRPDGTVVKQGDVVPFAYDKMSDARWTELKVEFDVATAPPAGAAIVLGVHLFAGRSDVLRNGWYFKDAALVRLPDPIPAPPPEPADELVWRQDSLLLMPGISGGLPYSGHLFGLQASRLRGADGASRRFVAATALPARLLSPRYLFSLATAAGALPAAGKEVTATFKVAEQIRSRLFGPASALPLKVEPHGHRAWAIGVGTSTFRVWREGHLLDVYQAPAPNPEPVSLAVSPYLGLAHQPVQAADLPLVLLFAELLAHDPLEGRLRPVASRVWSAPGKKEDGAVPLFSEETCREQALAWAKQTLRRHLPATPVAVVRFRAIVGQPPDGGGPGVAATRYSFRVVDAVERPELLSRPAFPLRAPAGHLRFREGQFGGSRMPQAVQAFEVAPPQTLGAQPLYIAQRDGWPWGLSAFRVRVRYTKGDQAVLGEAGSPAPSTLWWQALQHLVQFRTALSGRPAAGLPDLFRAPAIQSLLPVIPQPRLPERPLAGEARPPATPEPPAGGAGAAAAAVPLPGALVPHWQPVLPGALRYLLLGARPGAMLAIRNQLLRQKLGDDGASQDVLISGSVPVQHRMPRPAPLPANQAGRQAVALQTWAGFFDPEQNALLTSSPADEAFFAAADPQRQAEPAAPNPQAGAEPPASPPPLLAQRLRMVLTSPHRGAIGPEWDGKLEFDVTFDTTAGEAAPALKGLVVDLRVVAEGTSHAYVLENAAGAAAGPAAWKPQNLDALRAALGVLAPGATATAEARVRHTQDTSGFAQALSFPLRAAGGRLLPLPLAPAFVHFEDPEYNRSLASSPAHASTTVLESVDGRVEAHSVRLAADRKQYNPDGSLALRFDWDDGRTASAARLKLERVVDGIPQIVCLQKPADCDPQSKDTAKHFAVRDVMPGTLRQWRLQELGSFRPGDTLQLTLEVDGAGGARAQAVLPLEIVAEPVQPAPEAAYALLRWGIDGKQVQCARFAWGPVPSRVELVNADDLKGETVRRRAVFQWQDVARPGTVTGYAVQKIAHSGSTHVPEREPLA